MMIDVLINHAMQLDSLLQLCWEMGEIFSADKITEQVGVHQLVIIIGKVEVSEKIHDDKIHKKNPAKFESSTLAGNR